MVSNFKAMAAAVMLAGAMAFGGYSDKAQASEDEFFEGNFQIRVLGSGILFNEDVGNVTINGGLVPNAGVDIPNTAVPATTLTYFVNDNIAVELFCCIAKTTVDGRGALAGLNQLAKTSFFAPTLTAQYHFPMGNFKPYVGVGVNYLLFFEEDVGFGLAAAGITGISIDNAWGLALQAGVDIATGEHWSINVDVKKIFTKTDVTWTGAATIVANDLQLDPWIVSIGFGYRFDLF